MTDSTRSPRQRQTERGRAAFLAKFPDVESRRAYFRELGRRSAEGRLMLSSEEAAALREAYALLSRIVQRAGAGGDGAGGERCI